MWRKGTGTTDNIQSHICFCLNSVTLYEMKNVFSGL